MTARTDVSRSLPDRQHIGRQLREARDAVGLTQRQVAAMTGIRQCSVSYVERAGRDVLLSSVVDLAAAAGRVIVAAADYHLPLLDLTADELAVVIAVMADRAPSDPANDPLHASALAKLTTTEEPT